MIKFRFNNNYIYLKDNASISFVEENSLFSRENKTTSFQFEIPYKTNENALSHMLLSPNVKKLEPVYLIFKNKEIGGVIHINELNNDSLIVTFEPNSNFNINDENKLLNSLPFPNATTENILIDYPENGAIGTNPRMKWNKFWDGTDFETANESAVAFFGEFTYNEFHPHYLMCPYVSELLQKLFESQNYLVLENDIRDAASNYLKYLILIPNTTTKFNQKLIRNWNITIKEFFDNLFNALTILPIIDDSNKTVRIKLARDILDQNPIDISTYVDHFKFTPKDQKLGYYVKSNPPSAEQYSNPYVNIHENIDGTLSDAVTAYDDLPTTDEYKTIRYVTNDRNYYRFEHIQDPDASETSFIDKWVLFSYLSADYLQGDIEDAIQIENKIFPGVFFEEARWLLTNSRFNSVGNSQIHYDKQELNLYYAYFNTTGNAPIVAKRGEEEEFVHNYLNRKLAEFYMNSIPAEVKISPEVFNKYSIYNKFYAHGYTFFITTREYSIEQSGVKEIISKVRVIL